jgi:hypothetical protein
MLIRTLKAMGIPATIVAIVALLGITILGALGQVDSNALVAIYSAVIGGALGQANGTALTRADFEHRIVSVEKEQERASNGN